MVLYKIFPLHLNEVCLIEMESDKMTRTDSNKDCDLYKSYEKCGKEHLFISEIQQLQQLYILSIDNNNNIIHGSRWYILWHFHIFKKEIEIDNTIPQEQLFNSLNENIKRSLTSSVIKYVQREYFKYSYITQDDVTLQYGTEYDDLHMYNFFD